VNLQKLLHLAPVRHRRLSAMARYRNRSGAEAKSALDLEFRPSIRPTAKAPL
jgi:hypothetical protein